MTFRLIGLRLLSSFLLPAAFVAAGVGTGMAAEKESSLDDTPAKAAQILSAEVLEQTSIIQIETKPNLDKNGTHSPSSILIALPKSTTSYSVDAQGADISVPDGMMFMRGRPVIKAIIDNASTSVVDVQVSHNGNWNNERVDHDRLFSPAMNAALGQTIPDNFGTDSTVSQGSYIIIYPPAFYSAIQPLIDWKSRKGLRVQAVSTSTTGSTTASIKDWLQDAYDNAEFPPEYILMAGDVGAIPTYSFHGNPSDAPYVQFEGDDWLPDAIIGRLPAESLTQIQTMVNKIVLYERHPDMVDTSWFSKAVGVVGQYASETPLHTVRYCLSQLESIGYTTADTSRVYPTLNHGNYIVSPTQNSGPGLPPWGIVSGDGPNHIMAAIDEGSSFVVYRGWARGPEGWEPPFFTTNEIPSLNNGAKMPIVMSFVCQTGDYTATPASFGEVFVREGIPEDPTGGAIAFIGNGEHWSHTRYNDAMAMSIFERIVDSNITDLGTLLNAGKMRFMDFFPHEMNAADYGEESVEFYFHIYNLMGDPELNFWKQVPVLLSLEQPEVLTPGQNSISLIVYEANGITTVANARVGIMQDGQLIGSAYSDEFGSVTIPVSSIAAGSSVEVTISGSGLHPLETVIATETSQTFLGVTGMTVDDGITAGTGNGDGLANPGETLSILPTFTNAGTEDAPASSITMSVTSGNATVISGSVNVGSMEAGVSLETSDPFTLQLDEDIADGDLVTVTFNALNTGNHDLSSWVFGVHAPLLRVVSMTLADGSLPKSGETSDLILTLCNDGSAATIGGTITLSLLEGGDNSLLADEAVFGAITPGETIISEPGLTLSINDATPTGTNLTFNMATVFTEGILAPSNCALVVGPVNVSTPVGPDSYGYYAYDSADYDYPANRPIYQWQEISTAFGGAGTAIELTEADNHALDLIVELPFASFQYYGQEYSEIRISDNGWIAFDTSPFFNFYNWTIPTTHGNGALVAPFWDNLNPYMDAQPGPNGVQRDGIYTYHDEENGRFIVEWSRLPHYQEDILGLQTFQVILLDPSMHETETGDGEILFIYRQVTNNDYLRNYATVGIESPDGTDGLQLTYGGINADGMAPLQSGLAIKITTEEPIRVPYAVDALVASANGGVTTLNWEISDPRPVIGWHVDRVSGMEKTRLTTEALPGATRNYVHQGITADDETVSYVLTALHPYGTISQPGETTVQGTLAVQVNLYSAIPNPAHGEATIGFAIPQDSIVSLKVYDVAGRCVRTLVDGAVSAGQEFILWDGRSNKGLPVADGIYFYRLETGGKTLTRKLTFVR